MQGTYSLLVKGDLGEITVEDIAAASGVAVGTIYRRFASREALLRALMHRSQSEQLDALRHELEDDRWAGTDLSTRLDWLAEWQQAAVLAAPGLARAMFMDSIGPSPAAVKESTWLNNDAVAKITTWLLQADRVREDLDRDAIAITVRNLITSINLALLHPATFAPHDAGQVVPVLKAGALAAFEALRGSR